MIALLLGTVIAAAAPSLGLSKAAADSCRLKIDALDRRFKAKMTTPADAVSFSEQEVNSYLVLGGARLPVGLRNVSVSLRRDRLEASGMVDLDALKTKVPSSSNPMNPLWLLGGLMPFELKGKFTSQDGFGQAEIEEVRLGPVLLPPSVVAQIVASSTKSARMPNGVDLLAPFRLPYGVKTVRFEAYRALVQP